MEGSLSVYKFAPGYAKKTKTAITKAKDKAFAVDTLAVLPIIKAIAESMEGSKDLTDVIKLIKDLGSHRLLTPEEDAVRRILRALHEDTYNAREPRSTLLRDLQRERDDARAREAREAEFRRVHDAELRRKNEEIEKLRRETEEAQMQAALEISKRTAEEEAVKRAEAEAIAELSSESEEVSEEPSETQAERDAREERELQEALAELSGASEIESIVKKGSTETLEDARLRDNMNPEYDRIM
jgi:hypothetical protein